MNKLNIALLTLALGGAPAIAQDCEKPPAPTLPKGGSAAMEDMLAGQKSVKTFQSANMVYMKCLQALFGDAEKRAKQGSDEEKAAASAQYETAIEDYNTAVSQEEEVAGQFNTEIREYKAANPG